MENKKKMIADILAYYKLMFDIFHELRYEIKKKSTKHSYLVLALSLASNPQSIFKRAQKLLYTYYAVSDKDEIAELLREINVYYYFDTYSYPQFVYELTDKEKTFTFKNFEALFNYLERNPQYIELNIHDIFPHVKEYIVSEITVPLSQARVSELKERGISKIEKTLYFSFKGEKIHYLTKIVKSLSNEGYIGIKDEKIVCNIFQGMAVMETVNWRRDMSSLKILIDRLSGINYLNFSSMKWKTVSTWFLVKGKNIEPKSFRKLHNTIDSAGIIKILSIDIE